MTATARLRDVTPRGGLVLAVVAAFIFAGAPGFAASLGTASGGLGAGDTLVASCGTGMTFAYTTVFEEGAAGFAVDRINLSNIPSGCLSKSLSVTFEKGSSNALGSVVSVILPASGTTESISIDTSSNRIDAAQVSGVSVVVS